MIAIYEIQKFSEVKEFPNSPTGPVIQESFMEKARKSIEMLVYQTINDSNHQLFSIQKKYIGSGDRQYENEGYLDKMNI